MKDILAFPCNKIEKSFPSTHFESSTGMTLRDWFAGQALMGIIACDNTDNETGFSCIAKRAYLQADAMLAERTTHANQ